ncbi:MAG: hypothetical protein PUC15_06075 [Lentisphaeria bacterium]|nr:hypothetical protein [Lentisphaeria bacterium]MDD6337933.1 hypothetical protein [Lentisphaeria bacterium]
MNRSILIVTCDFLVLAAMSLSIGMTEVGDPAGAAKISSPASSLVEMIDEELARHEQVRIEKDELEKRLEEFRALALKDEKQIASKDEEIAQAQAKLSETLAALTKSKDELTAQKAQSEQELAKSAAELARIKKDLDDREEALKRSAAVITQKENELKLSAQEIVERDKVIRESEDLLEKSERSLAQITKEKTDVSTRLQDSEKTLSRTSGQLELTKLELEALREQARLDRERADDAMAKFHAAEVELVQTKSKLTTAETQLNGMVQVLTDVNSELTKTKTDLDESQQNLAVTKETLAQNEKIIGEKDKLIAEKQKDLADTRQEAAELKKMLSNDSLTSYNASALELSFHLVNDRLLNNITIDKSFFLPAVSLGGKSWLVSAFRDTTGLTLYSGYTKVTELAYKVRRPQSKDKWTPVTGPALCLAEDSRVCLFPVEAGKAEPIQAITFGALRERGLDNLTLFKSGTFSKDSADITGRCSVSLEQGDNHLYIRNPNRSSSELKADVGDIVISKEGFFVGVVVKVSSSDLGQTSTAQVYVFPGEPELAKALQLRLTKEPSQTLFYDFVERHEDLRKRAEQLDKGK